MSVNQSTLRITKEITSLQRGPDLSLAVAHKDEDVRRVHALIIGPPDTPYEFGFFEFSVHFHKDYPTSAPHVKALTTNCGQTRFNPNIYADGKVCLSILGTWRGESGEQWSSAQGLESVLISIQSLMAGNPYENEPGFENPKGDSDQKDAKLYALKIRHETLRLSIIEPLEALLGVDVSLRRADNNPAHYKLDAEDDPDAFRPFDDLIKRRFLWYYHTYLDSVAAERAKDECKDNTKFQIMPFESRPNQMAGSFNYTDLRKRLEKLRQKLEQETESWESDGKAALRNENPVALAFQNRFRHIVAAHKKADLPTELELINNNPFAWRLTYFGRPGSNLEGGVFNIRIVVPVDFPTRYPRVKLETKLFHQRVSPDGVLCYFAAKGEDFESHVAGILEAIEEEAPPYDPRTVVHKEAAQLCWGDENARKMYRRKLRRSAEESTEG
ncbi:MAG: hypothetical protein Q9159_007716 [Coniocarpon cinnabarinum]